MLKKPTLKKYLELYRREYEEFCNVNSFDKSHQMFTIDEQIVRYSKHLAFWFMKIDEIENTKPKDKKQRELFLQLEICRTMNTIQQMFPYQTVERIIYIASQVRGVHTSLYNI